jgi:hypothetical protein
MEVSRGFIAYLLLSGAILFYLLTLELAHAEINDEIQQTAWNISKTTYHPLYYNCWDFSTDLFNALKKEGYKPKIMQGMFDFNSPHSWIEINDTWIEAISGEVIYDRTMYDYNYPGMPKYNPFKVRYLKGLLV